MFVPLNSVWAQRVKTKVISIELVITLWHHLHLHLRRRDDTMQKIHADMLHHLKSQHNQYKLSHLSLRLKVKLLDS